MASNHRSLQVIIDGSTSHTHDPNRKLQAFLWEDVTSGEVVSKNQVPQCFYPFGTYTLALTITDDAMESLGTSQTVVVARESNVPGTDTPCLHFAGLQPSMHCRDAEMYSLHVRLDGMAWLCTSAYSGPCAVPEVSRPCVPQQTEIVGHDP